MLGSLPHVGSCPSTHSSYIPTLSEAPVALAAFPKREHCSNVHRNNLQYKNSINGSRSHLTYPHLLPTSMLGEQTTNHFRPQIVHPKNKKALIFGYSAIQAEGSNTWRVVN